MHKQGAVRLAEKLQAHHPDLCVEAHCDGKTPRRWLVTVYDPLTRETQEFEREHDAHPSPVSRDIGVDS